MRLTMPSCYTLFARLMAFINAIVMLITVFVFTTTASDSPNHDRVYMSRPQSYKELCVETNKLLEANNLPPQKSISKILRQSLPDLISRHRQATQYEAQVIQVRQTLKLPPEASIIQAIAEKTALDQQQIKTLQAQVSQLHTETTDLRKENSNKTKFERDLTAANEVLHALRTLRHLSPHEDIVANIRDLHTSFIRHQHLLADLRSHLGLGLDDDILPPIRKLQETATNAQHCLEALRVMRQISSNDDIRADIQTLQATAQNNALLIIRVRDTLNLSPEQDLISAIHQLQTTLQDLNFDHNEVLSLFGLPALSPLTMIVAETRKLQAEVAQKNELCSTLQIQIATLEKGNEHLRQTLQRNESISKEAPLTSSSTLTPDSLLQVAAHDAPLLLIDDKTLHPQPPFALKEFCLGAGVMGLTAVTIIIIWKARQPILSFIPRTH